jgi:hypothetical protein
MSATLLLVSVLLRPQDTPEQAARRALFQGHAKVSFRGDWMIVHSDCLPNHPTADYPNRENPNSIRKIDLEYWIPMHPKKAAKTSPTPFGPIGIATNGIPFFNQYNAEGGDAVRLETFDSCCGHPNQDGMYHYHQYPVCFKSPFKESKDRHSPLVGFMFDGFAMYGPNGDDGKPPKDFDACNGHEDSVRGYHYHATTAFPYLIGSYRGTPVRSDFGPRR